MDGLSDLEILVGLTGSDPERADAERLLQTCYHGRVAAYLRSHVPGLHGSALAAAAASVLNDVVRTVCEGKVQDEKSLISILVKTCRQKANSLLPVGRDSSTLGAESIDAPDASEPFDRCEWRTRARIRDALHGISSDQAAVLGVILLAGNGEITDAEIARVLRDKGQLISIVEVMKARRSLRAAVRELPVSDERE